jgi:hypothetical protein
MQIDGYVEAVRDDLTRVAALGDESTARAADLLAVALEASFARRLQEALSEAALELSGKLERGSVEVRIAGGEPELVYVEEAAPETADASADTFSARITLRLPEVLKAQLEVAAAANGMSVNTWLVQTLSRVLAPRHSGRGRPNRLTGYGRS